MLTSVSLQQGPLSCSLSTCQCKVSMQQCVCRMLCSNYGKTSQLGPRVASGSMLFALPYNGAKTSARVGNELEQPQLDAITTAECLSAPRAA